MSFSFILLCEHCVSLSFACEFEVNNSFYFVSSLFYQNLKTKLGFVAGSNKMTVSKQMFCVVLESHIMRTIIIILLHCFQSIVLVFCCILINSNWDNAGL